MTTKENRSEKDSNPLRSRLVSWPLALIGLTLAFVLIAGSVSAWGRHRGHDMGDMRSHADRFLDRALNRLDATDEQSETIRAIVTSTLDELESNHDGHPPGREEFRALLMADSIDRVALEELRQTHLTQADEMTRIVSENLAEIAEILTLEQREKLASHFDKHHGDRGHGHGHRGWGKH